MIKMNSDLISLSRIKLPVNPRGKGGINNIADLRAQWHQGHETLQQNISWWSGCTVALLQQEEIGCHIFRKQLKRESVPYLPIYWFIKLFFYAKMLDVSAALSTMYFFFFFHMPIFSNKSNKRCKVSSPSLQIFNFVHILAKTYIMPCDEHFSWCISVTIQTKSY